MEYSVFKQIKISFLVLICLLLNILSIDAYAKKSEVEKKYRYNYRIKPVGNLVGSESNRSEEVFNIRLQKPIDKKLFFEISGLNIESIKDKEVIGKPVIEFKIGNGFSRYFLKPPFLETESDFLVARKIKNIVTSDDERNIRRFQTYYVWEGIKAQKEIIAHEQFKRVFTDNDIQDNCLSLEFSILLNDESEIRPVLDRCSALANKIISTNSSSELSIVWHPSPICYSYFHRPVVGFKVFAIQSDSDQTVEIEHKKDEGSESIEMKKIDREDRSMEAALTMFKEEFSDYTTEVVESSRKFIDNEKFDRRRFFGNDKKQSVEKRSGGVKRFKSGRKPDVSINDIRPILVGCPEDYLMHKSCRFQDKEMKNGKEKTQNTHFIIRIPATFSVTSGPEDKHSYRLKKNGQYNALQVLWCYLENHMNSYFAMEFLGVSTYKIPVKRIMDGITEKLYEDIHYADFVLHYFDYVNVYSKQLNALDIGKNLPLGSIVSDWERLNTNVVFPSPKKPGKSSSKKSNRLNNQGEFEALTSGEQSVL